MRSSGIITLGVLLLAFSAIAGADEFSCTDVADCINGDSCRGGYCMCSAWWEVTPGTNGPCNVSTAEACEADTCMYGTCSVVDHKTVCDCEDGASGSACDVLEDHCTIGGTENPCKNGGICTNQLTTYECSCVEGSHWAGITCEEYSYFSVKAGEQVVYTKDFTSLSLKLMKDTPTWDTLLLMFYVNDGAADKKVTITAAPGTELKTTLHMKGETPVVNHQAQNTIAWGTWRSLDVKIAGGNLTVRENDKEIYNAPTSAVKMTKVMFGGCGWLTEGDCGVKDSVHYDEFIGGVQGLTLDDKAVGYETSLGGHKDMFTCSDLTCNSFGSSGCVADPMPHCVCNPGYGDPTCSQYSQASFNGYTSAVNAATDYTFLGGSRQVLISFSVTKDVKEVTLKSVSGMRGNTEYLAVVMGSDLTEQFKIMYHAGVAADDMLEIGMGSETPVKCIRTNNEDKHLMIEVKLNDEYYYCKAGATPDMSHPTMSMVLGKGDALGTGEANLQGCITDLVIDGQAMYFPSNSGTKVDFMKCVSDMLPDVKPCADNGDCGDNGDCQIDMANYSAKCTCHTGYKGTLCETADMCGLVTDICGVAEAVKTCTNTESDPFYECKCNTRYKLDKTSTCVMDKCYDCNLAVADGHASICQYDTTTEVAQCTCTEGWQGETCGAEAAKQKSSTQTTLIIVVVALLVLMVVLITVIFTVRRCNRKNQGEGTYSPNKAELEMGATPPAKGDNIYKNSEVIENVNAESKLFETDDANIDTSYNIYNINAEVSPTPAENGVRAEENVYDVPDSPAPVPTYDDIVAAPVVEEISPPPPPMEDPPLETANDLPAPPTPLNTTAAESPNVTMETNNNNGVVMETKDAGVDEVKVDIEECDDSNRLSTI